MAIHKDARSCAAFLGLLPRLLRLLRPLSREKPVSTIVRRPLQAADILTVSEVAELLHVPASTVSDWARRGILPSVKLGRRRIFIRQHIEARLLEK